MFLYYCIVILFLKANVSQLDFLTINSLGEKLVAARKQEAVYA